LEGALGQPLNPKAIQKTREFQLEDNGGQPGSWSDTLSVNNELIASADWNYGSKDQSGGKQSLTRDRNLTFVFADLKNSQFSCAGPDRLR
jgi:hypothetical protein